MLPMFMDFLVVVIRNVVVIIIIITITIMLAGLSALVQWARL